MNRAATVVDPFEQLDHWHALRRAPASRQLVPSPHFVPCVAQFLRQTLPETSFTQMLPLAQSASSPHTLPSPPGGGTAPEEELLVVLSPLDDDEELDDDEGLPLDDEDDDDSAPLLEEDEVVAPEELLEEDELVAPEEDAPPLDVLPDDDTPSFSWAAGILRARAASSLFVLALGAGSCPDHAAVG